MNTSNDTRNKSRRAKALSMMVGLGMVAQLGLGLLTTQQPTQRQATTSNVLSRPTVYTKGNSLGEPANPMVAQGDGLSNLIDSLLPPHSASADEGDCDGVNPQPNPDCPQDPPPTPTATPTPHID